MASHFGVNLATPNPLHHHGLHVLGHDVQRTPQLVTLRRLSTQHEEARLELAKSFQEVRLIFSFQCSLHECLELLEVLGRERGLRRSASTAWHVVLKLRTNQISIATQKTNISSSLLHNVPRMARCAASQPPAGWASRRWAPTGPCDTGVLPLLAGPACCMVKC